MNLVQNLYTPPMIMYEFNYSPMPHPFLRIRKQNFQQYGIIFQAYVLLCPGHVTDTIGPAVVSVANTMYPDLMVSFHSFVCSILYIYVLENIVILFFSLLFSL